MKQSEKWTSASEVGVVSSDEFLIAQAAVTPEPIPGDDPVSGDAPVTMDGATTPGDAPNGQVILPIIPEGEIPEG